MSKSFLVISSIAQWGVSPTKSTQMQDVAHIMGITLSGLDA